MIAYQVYDGYNRVSQPFISFSESRAFAHVKRFNPDTIPVTVRENDLVRDGNDIYKVMLDGKLEKVGRYYPGDPLRF